MIGYLVFSALGYLSGSVLYAPLIGRLFGADIVSGSDDHNPGGMNALKQAGPAAGVLAISCDIVKAFVPVYLAYRFLDPHRLLFGLVLCAPVLGHAFALFSHFRGGKAIAAAFGVTIGLFPCPRPFLMLACPYLFFTLVLIVKPNLIRSVLAFGTFALLSLFFTPEPGVALGCALCGGLVILRHAMAYKGEKMRVAFLRAPAKAAQEGAHPGA